MFLSAPPYLKNAIVILDKCGSPDFRNELAAYLRSNLNRLDYPVIKKIKQQDSRKNNLIQVADYISGILARKYQEKQDWFSYYQYIADKQLSVQLIPD